MARLVEVGRVTDSSWTASNLLDILGDDLSRRVLIAADDSPVPASQLIDRLEVSPPTVYRRIDTLVEHGFLVEHRRRDSDGNHYRTFETTLDRIEIELTAEGYEISVEHRQDLDDRFDTFWTDFASSAPTTLTERSDRSSTNSDDTPAPQ